MGQLHHAITVCRNDKAYKAFVEEDLLPCIVQLAVAVRALLCHRRRSKFQCANLFAHNFVFAPPSSIACLCNILCDAKQVRNEKAWRQINRNVLMQTRKPSPAVRFAALRVTQELFKTLGEDFMMMLPESIPFLSELMEDESEEVEALCQRLMKQLEEMSGEKLDEYLE